MSEVHIDSETIRSLQLRTNMNWSDVKTNNTDLSSVFSTVDNGDGIIQQDELDLLDVLTYKKRCKNLVPPTFYRTLFSKFKDPQWMNEKGVEFLKLMDSKVLQDVVESYSAKQKFLLNEISENKNIQDNVKERFLSLATSKLKEACGYDEKKWTKTADNVSNDVYTSPHTYNTTFKDNTVTIVEVDPKDSTKKIGKEYRLDLDNLLKELSIDARPKTLAELQKLPAEVLMDLAIEVEHFMDPSSKNYSNGSDSAAFFDNRDEKITLANRNIEDITANTIAHELGHAINYRLINATPESKEDMNGVVPNFPKYNFSSSIHYDQKLHNEFINARNQFNGFPDYMFQYEDGREAPSELYAKIMLGHTSTTDDSAFTPRLINAYINDLNKVRTLSEEARHIKTDNNYYYTDDNGQVQKLVLKPDEKFPTSTGNAKLDEIIRQLDNGDSIIQQGEVTELRAIFKQIDNMYAQSSNNGTLEANEIAGFNMNQNKVPDNLGSDSSSEKTNQSKPVSTNTNTAQPARTGEYRDVSEFSYYDKNGQIQKFNLPVGDEWSKHKTGNKQIDNIIKKIDDDGIIQYSEKILLSNYLQALDTTPGGTSGNMIIESGELESFDIKNSTISNEVSTSAFSKENLLKEFPKDKYDYDYSYNRTTIYRKGTGEQVLSFLGSLDSEKDNMIEGSNAYIIDNLQGKYKIKKTR